MIVLLHILVVILRMASNVFAVPFFGAVAMALFFRTGDASFFGTFTTTYGAIFHWLFTSTPGLVVTAVLAILGCIHGVRLAVAKTHASGLGVVGLILDSTWASPNQILGSIWATITLYIPIAPEASRGSGRLVLQNGVFANYATTLGNVTAGTDVPHHEFQHVLQSWIFGPFFYPIFAVNYIFNTVIPVWWAIKALFKIWPSHKIDSFSAYFIHGVYPFTLFEVWAYAVEGHP